MKRLLLILSMATSAVATVRAENRLAGENSSFLRAHAQDAIAWMPWGDAAFAKAQAEQKPIYLCIGSFTNELSRAMQKQSFSNAQIVTTLNENFVCILVDREVRPDIATLYQSYIQAAKQLNGWPVNVWLTPELKPFEGAAYLPPSEEWGKEGIANVVKRVLTQWKDSVSAARAQADEMAATTATAEAYERGPAFSADAIAPRLSKATTSWLEKFDPKTNAFGDAPHFLEPELLRYLLRSPGPGREAAVATLRAMDRAPIHDQLGDGFFHRSIDAAWQLPSFQKILGDQARLALAYLDAAKVMKDDAFSTAARSALDYSLNHLSRSGLFIHAEDGTPDEVLRGFGWSTAEIKGALDEKSSSLVARVFGMTDEGNVALTNDAAGRWKGKNLLLRDDTALNADENATLAAAKVKLLKVRDQRLQPLLDDNTLVGENALFAFALLRAGEQLKEPRYLEKGRETISRLSSLAKAGALPHLASGGSAGVPEDYAWVAAAVATEATYSKNGDTTASATALLEHEQSQFLDAATGRFFAASAHEKGFWFRPHYLEPSPGDALPPETATVFASLALHSSPANVPEPLLRTIAAALADPNGTPRGDLLLTAAMLTQP